MRIIVVNGDVGELKELTGAITAACPDAECLGFDDPLAALAEAREEEIDAAFIDVVLPDLEGLVLGTYLKDLNPFVNLIFLAENGEKAYEALSMHASGYLLKPVSSKQAADELCDLRYPESQKKSKRVFAQTFGDFELFVDGKPVAFKYSKTKEMVAILINNRGAQTTNGEIIACLWEDDGDPEKKTSYLCNLRQDLQNTFNRLKLSGLLLKQRGSMAIAVDKIECDLYDWLKYKKESKYHYMGDYMSQYSWPEYRHAELDEISYALYDDE